MAYNIISQNNTTTTLQDENGNILRVPATVTLATSTKYEITKVNNNTATLVSEDGKTIRNVPCVVVLAGGSDSHNLGYYDTLESLVSEHPTGEAGDWAIVADSNTVYIWSDSEQKWVDTDQKGQVTSVNDMTGDVILKADDILKAGDGIEISDGEISVLPSAIYTTLMLTLRASDWALSDTEIKQEVSASLITSSQTLIVAPAPLSAEDYVDCGIICIEQNDGSLVFKSTQTPVSDINVNVVIMGA